MTEEEIQKMKDDNLTLKKENESLKNGKEELETKISTLTNDTEKVQKEVTRLKEKNMSYYDIIQSQLEKEKDTVIQHNKTSENETDVTIDTLLKEL